MESKKIYKRNFNLIARPILKRAKDYDLKLFPVTNIKILKGEGVSACHNKKVILVGNLELMKEFEIVIPENVLKNVEKKEKDGNSAIFVSIDRELIGIIFIADKLREEAKSVLWQLKKMGFKLVILTGDNKFVANKIANKQCGIPSAKFCFGFIKYRKAFSD